ncbi:TonB-dependent receptor [Roseateles sp.]|uniref:TonB-dependent receptor n=1 Tax=Roseateles sp. TaxID=1971397 RepID=UPI0031DC35C2
MSRLNTHGKQLVLTSIAIAATLSCGAAFAQESTTLERVEVTGSNIKRVDAETVSPVQIISREQIERTGQPTVADVLRNLPSNTGSLGESFSNSFAPGAAGFSLRGLGQKTTLVLLNGRRVAGYGFAQNLQDTFVDLNSIPSAAVERIDILKDGASAIYGSDAIAGVVNIILRKDYRGFDITASKGFYEGKGDYRVTAAGGLGDLSTDGFNVFGTIDYYKREELLQSDVEFTESRDFRKYAGGRNFQSLTAGGTWRQVTATGGNTSIFRAISDCKGKVMTGPEALAAGLIDPNTQAAFAAATNTFCTLDQNGQLSALPGTERIGFLGRATKVFSPNATGYVELGLSRADTEQTFTAPSFATTALKKLSPTAWQPFTYNVTFAPNVAGNPMGADARYTGSLNDMGTRDAKIRSDATRVLAGVNYSIGSWDLDSGVGFSRTETKQDNLNRLSLPGVSAAFGVGTGLQPPIPRSTGSTYNLDKWTTNSDAVRDSIRANFDRKSTSEMQFIDTKANTTLGAMPGGDIGLAIGAEYRSEKLKDSPAKIADDGNVLGQGITATDGKRHNYSVFTEVSMPFTKKLEVQAAARFDKYSDYGKSTTPKLGAKYKAFDGLLLRANWGKGFRAPTLPEISPSSATFFTSVIDPQDSQVRQVSGVFKGNPGLQAETSTSTTFGAVFEPTKNFNIGIDFYKIDWRNVVASRSLQDIINDSCPTPPPAGNTDPTKNCPSTADIIRDGNNLVATIMSQYQNLAQRKTSGIDIDSTLRVPTSFGKFTFRGNLIYVSSFKEDGEEYVGTNGGSNTIPRIRAGFTTDFDYGPWSITGGLNYTHKVRQTLLPGSYTSVYDPTGKYQNGAYPEFVRSNTTFDLYGRYNITKKLQASVSVLNVFNRMPPYDPGFSSTSLYDFSLYDTRGRQFRATLKYSM